MKLYQAGDRSVGICEHCKAEVFTRMEYRDYTPTGWDVTVPDVLVAVCEQCDQVVAVPHQSMPKVNEYRKRKDDLKAIECRISRAVEEVVDLVTANLGGDRNAIRPAIIRYYLNIVAENPKIAEAIKRESGESGVKQKNDRRITIKIQQHQWGAAWSAAKRAGITSSGQLVRGIAGLAARDFHISAPAGLLAVVDAGSPKESKARRDNLQSLAKAIL